MLCCGDGRGSGGCLCLCLCLVRCAVVSEVWIDRLDDTRDITYAWRIYPDITALLEIKEVKMYRVFKTQRIKLVTYVYCDVI